MTVLLDGRKVGSLRIDRQMQGDRVVTTQVLDFRLTRARTPLALRTELRSTESNDGAPLAFYASTRMSTQENLATGEARDDGTFQVANTVGGQSKVNLLIWPTGATLAEGQRLTMAAHGFKPGTSYRLRNFDSDQATGGERRCGGHRRRSRGHAERGPARPSITLRQSIANAAGDHSVDIWVDDNGYHPPQPGSPARFPAGNSVLRHQPAHRRPTRTSTCCAPRWSPRPVLCSRRCARLRSATRSPCAARSPTRSSTPTSSRSGRWAMACTWSMLDSARGTATNPARWPRTPPPMRGCSPTAERRASRLPAAPSGDADERPATHAPHARLPLRLHHRQGTRRRLRLGIGDDRRHGVAIAPNMPSSSPRWRAPWAFPRAW